MYQEGNNLSPEVKERLRSFQWGPNQFLDLHQIGCHYYNSDYLPTWLDPMTYASIWRRGLTPPNALPIYTDESTEGRIRSFLEDNYYKLSMGGLPYLGNECNVQPASEFDKKPIRVCFARLSDYVTLDGAFGGYIINNFIQNYTDEVFVDFAYMPTPSDVPKLMAAGLPLLFGTTTKKPLSSFDIVIVATTYAGERVHAPLALVRSGIPMYRWERFSKDLPYRDKTPMTAIAGIGATAIESLLADNPVKGAAQNALFNHVLIGEGELLDLKYILQYLYTVIRDKQPIETFMDQMTNQNHPGVYDPTRVFFEYADKVHILRDYTGKELSRKVYPSAGAIKRISLLDHDNKTKHVIAGVESEEFRDMEAVHKQFSSAFVGVEDSEEVGRAYIKLSSRPTLEQRVAAGMKNDLPVYPPPKP